MPMRAICKDAFRRPGVPHFNPHSFRKTCIAIDGWIAQRNMTSPVCVQTELDEAIIYVVADRMGGHAAGEIASALAVRDLVTNSRDIGDAAQLEECVG
jgi:integrase